MLAKYGWLSYYSVIMFLKMLFLVNPHIGNTYNKYKQWYQQSPIRMEKPNPYTASNEA